MKMQLTSLTLENFKCYEHMEFRFDGRNASIFGANGTGKSSVYDAFTWLLFGKDSKGSAKSEALKPIVQEGEHMGEVKDSGAITSVEAVLLVDGMERKLKRTYYELWSTKRGSAEKTRDGHSSDYFVDDVPCKKNEFARRVGEIIDEDRFKLLTNLFFFPEALPWQKRREVLFDVAAVATDEEILASDARFAPLASALRGLTLDDYRKKLAAQRKGLNKTREYTPARLDECKKTIGISPESTSTPWNGSGQRPRSAGQRPSGRWIRRSATAAGQICKTSSPASAMSWGGWRTRTPPTGWPSSRPKARTRLRRSGRASTPSAPRRAGVRAT